MKLTSRRLSRTRVVGWPLSSSSQWRSGHSYGELRIGRSKNLLLTRVSADRCSSVTKTQKHAHGNLIKLPQVASCHSHSWFPAESMILYFLGTAGGQAGRGRGSLQGVSRRAWRRRRSEGVGQCNDPRAALASHPPVPTVGLGIWHAGRRTNVRISSSAMPSVHLDSLAGMDSVRRGAGQFPMRRSTTVASDAREGGGGRSHSVTQSKCIPRRILAAERSHAQFAKTLIRVPRRPDHCP